MRCGVRAVLRILFLCFGVWCCVGRCFDVELYLGVWCGIWEVPVYCGFGRVDFLGGLRNGVKV